VVAYTTDLKRNLLGVSDLSHGVVSEETALAMAAGARKVLGVDVAVGVTGSAGPDSQEQPVGTMVIAVETPIHAAANTLRLPGDRERVRTYAATAALHHLRLAVMGEWWNR
jgi:nicotinamide-nucleotide amidase